MKSIYARCLVALLTGLTVMPVSAAVKEIEALFRPDSGNPQSNEFINQTPSEGFCLQLPGQCKPEGLFTLIAPIEFNASNPIQAFHTDPRQGGWPKCRHIGSGLSLPMSRVQPRRLKSALRASVMSRACASP